MILEELTTYVKAEICRCYSLGAHCGHFRNAFQELEDEIRQTLNQNSDQY